MTGRMIQDLMTQQKLRKGRIFFMSRYLCWREHTHKNLRSDDDKGINGHSEQLLFFKLESLGTKGWGEKYTACLKVMEM